MFSAHHVFLSSSKFGALQDALIGLHFVELLPWSFVVGEETLNLMKQHQVGNLIGVTEIMGIVILFMIDLS